MGTAVLIDTNIVIDLLAGIPQAAAEVRRHAERAISVITWIEVMAGLRDNERDLAHLIADNFPIIPLTTEIATETINLRQTTRLKLPDAVILATAHIGHRVLLTRNTRDFSPGRFVEIPYTL